jgi:hypothetical protein
MKLPSRTLEVCVPAGKAEEALARPPENNDCKLSDVQRAGNKFSANIKCSGQAPVEGRIEQTTEGNRTIGKMQMQMQGMAMTMNFDSTKLGTACEATDYSDYKPPVATVPNVVAPDVCGQMGERVKGDPRDLANLVAFFVEKDAQCTKHASFKTYCSAVQSPAGFASLARQERSMAGTTGDRGSAFVVPLTTSVQACGLGSGKPGVDALRTKLLATAEKDAAWDFLVQEGNDATFAMLTATAKRECSGRSFTSAANSRYAGLCRNYGVALARGDRDAALSAAGVSSGASEQPAEAPAAEEPADTKSKARNALDKGKQRLRGILGGG